MNDLIGHLWEEAKRRFPTGRLITGTVSRHCPFGIFVDLGHPGAIGLVQITDFLDQGRMTPDLYPPIGTSIQAVVLGHTGDRRRQVWLGMRPSQLQRTEGRKHRDLYDTPEL